MNYFSCCRLAVSPFKKIISMRKTIRIISKTKRERKKKEYSYERERKKVREREREK